jgi:two-component sensor histidine kinase
VSISLHSTNSGGYVLEVRDNGIGIPVDVDVQNSDSLGMQVVTALANELDASIQVDNDNGTSVRLLFTIPDASQGSKT